ncbi:MAG: enoyl-CoA hydratase/isomerase family protein [Polaribacter sp.]|jgi:methylglutaconyl-CoA hydratase|uniref:enoyl-CoA hydratase/isomerase family protein n=1 Tax=Polaribacter sp. TaxID=1920175 RepID=UPI0026203172|nr:enoyl-CoA hydratase/isomerase family protein [Polaribacter sp.]MBT4413795.1 enoyl-CoA hydratase/isomerase family protein [Polaribacter sp.]MDG1195673.1 enoyl-CoA hydratase/isomerase family protein [Polaribacter sp.]MDG1402653.1 enoyl-CoA hydratase/isomerase family protein [Polaribacter sp.]MDG2436773.1 enoyl-CoA hydratase/isomerase family protein [Polaribacter sp.]
MTTTRQNGSLYTSLQNNIATIEFGHPASNSFPSELLNRLTKELNSISENDAISVVILKSEGEKAFCAGASFDELVAISNLQEGEKFFTGFANVINAMRTCGKIIIGRVQGKTVGGGVGLASACDYVLATENAAIKLSELTIGIGPFVIEPVVKRKIGLAALSELTLDATNWKTAYWAKEKGLYAKVFETVKELDEEVEILASKLASYNPSALGEMKKVLWENTQNWNELLAERALVSGKLVLSDFTKKALSKFSKK